MQEHQSTEEKLRNLPLKEIRERGIGLNFDVKEPKDGHRLDNSLWFGICTSCKEPVTSSLHDRLWMHNITLSIKYHDSGHILSRESKQIDYCPLGAPVLD